jgi:regulator of protease activity HflC (stomatin/prohibitin superfamily)
MNIKNRISGIALVLFLIILFTSTFITVRPGTVQVVTRLGQVTGRVLHPGAHLILPFVESTLTYDTKKVIYEVTSAEKQRGSMADYKDFPVDTNTKDGQQVDLYYTVRFSIDPQKATWVAQNIGNEDALVEKVVKTDSRIWARNIPREYDAAHLYTGNVMEVQEAIENKLKPIFEANGIILDEVGIREIKFAEQYIAAIEAKQIEAVKVETEKNKAAQAEYQKEQRITQAEGMAKEQELQRQTITEELLQKMAIEKWNGVLPVYMGSNTPVPFLNINQ